jgi:hypothetical protein
MGACSLWTGRVLLVQRGTHPMHDEAADHERHNEGTDATQLTMADLPKLPEP